MNRNPNFGGKPYPTFLFWQRGSSGTVWQPLSASPDDRVPRATNTLHTPVVVLDPVNPDDNVTADWTGTDRELFLDRLDQLRDTLRDAEIEVDYDLDTAISFLDQSLPKFQDFSKE